MNLRIALRTVALTLALALLAAGAQAAPPTRVARLGYMDGEVSFLEAGEADWVQASLNRPLTSGDQLWTDRSAVAELQLDGASIRMGERSNLSVLNLDESITRLQLSQGAVRLRVRALEPQQSIEIQTPNLAMVLRRTGNYRIEVDPQGDATLVLVQSGQAEVYGDGASYRVDSSQAYRFYGSGLSDYEVVADYRADALDRWAQEREQRLDHSASARFVPAGVVGYEDLDANGRWVVDANYGNVWLPSRVDAGWTPYRDGRWTWVDPWGWTWIDDAPWGYAVSHYGRWAYLGNAWGWVPGPARERQVYRPGQPSHEGYANQHVRGAVVAPVNQSPRERAPDTEARSRPPRDNHPVVIHGPPTAPAAAAVAAPAQSRSRREPPAGLPVVTPSAAPASITVPPATPRHEAARAAESIRNNAAHSDAAPAEAAKAEAVRADAGKAARAEPVRLPGRNADAQRGNAQRPDRELTPEEELPPRGRRKQ